MDNEGYLGWLFWPVARMGTIAGFAIAELLVIVFFWHPIMSFIVLIFVFEILSLSASSEVPVKDKILLERVAFFVKSRRNWGSVDVRLVSEHPPWASSASAPSGFMGSKSLVLTPFRVTPQAPHHIVLSVLYCHHIQVLPQYSQISQNI